MSSKRLLLVFIWLCLTPTACNDQSANSPAEIIATQPPSQEENLPSIIDLLSQDPELALFVNTLTSSGVLPALDGEGPYTVLAPTNEAFTKIGLASFQLDPDDLQQMAQYHIVLGKLIATEGVSAVSAPTLQGEPVTFAAEGEETKVNYALMTTADIPASNGIIHVIDRVLLPSEKENANKSVWGTLVNDGRFTRLVELMGGSETMYMLRFDDFADAFLAPTDEAFAQMPPEIETLFPTRESYDILFDYWILAPDGWPRGTPLTTADMLAMDEIPTRVPRSSPEFGVSGFANGFETLPVTGTADNLMIGEAHIIEGDLYATNGIIHVIDKVLFSSAVLEHLEGE